MEGKGEIEERKHGNYKGVRKRNWGAWVSEIRVPKKKERLWLGSFPAPEVAALAHDIAELGLKGSCAKLNFPEHARGLEIPSPVSTSAIRTAAFEAAVSLGWLPHHHHHHPHHHNGKENEGNGNNGNGAGAGAEAACEYVDEELLFEMPSILSYMASALLLAPPSVSFPANLPENDHDFEDISLWQ